MLDQPEVQQRIQRSRNSSASLACCGPLMRGVDMASLVKRAYHVLGTSGRWVERDNSSPIGEAAGSSVTTVDQADMRALVSRQTVVRHGAASL